MFKPAPCEPSFCTNSDGKSAGFTLIEALVSLAVAGVVLAAIGTLVAGNLRGYSRIEQHIMLVETLRAVETGLPDRDRLGGEELTGEMHGQAWAVNSSVFPAEGLNPRAARIWAPVTVAVTVQSPGGGVFQINTIRLVKRAGGP